MFLPDQSTKRGCMMTLVILAAGLGSRYGGLKQLDPVTDGGEFIIDFSIYDAIRAGFDRVVFIIKKENAELFHQTIGSRVEKKIKVAYCYQGLDVIPQGCKVPEGREKPLGTGHAVLCAAELVQDNFAVINSDDFYGREAFEKLAAHLKQAKAGDCCMVGYRLANTLSENGSVSRGECRVDAEGNLCSVTERTKITPAGDHAVYEDNGNMVELSLDTVVSMNCWGLTPDVFTKMNINFKSFMESLADSENPLKQEFYLPFAVEDLMKSGDLSVKVYNTDAVWYGVTYKEDKPAVMAGLRELIARGEYPAKLWD
jgi:UTP-glucose-1-phosphate uridylyltransferase